jgi:DNA polymerase
MLRSGSAKPQRQALLGCDDLDPDVREFVMAVEEAGGATISKYEAFTDRSMDGRLYGAFLYAGGGQTGRFSSIGVQVHNLKRDGHKDPEKAIAEVLHGSNIASPSEHLSKLIRAVIAHPDGLVWANY